MNKMKKNGNMLKANLRVKVAIIAVILISIFLIYLIEFLASWPLPRNLYHTETSAEAYLSMLYKLRVFQDDLQNKNIAVIELTQEEIKAYIFYDKEFAREYSIDSFYIKDGNLEVIISNKIRGQIYELWFSFHLEAKEGNIILLVSQAKVGRLPLPGILSQYLANKMVEGMEPELFFDKVFINGEKISIIAKKE
ncbi:MAG: hypothetical protein DDT42_00563 [candidate division WS2 bacterium]|uniref:Uncharacterized protein n=1 Tax=Psychracetigena formicireducens TaxID=2986056 RepID=A0A9E2F1G8_PSYF1|nr:hypothetical protein [Candidatus Psychracetigena formicireducens]MBT9144717.1 hypothetical protein [Candidatus Psychracetigena formicireducens]